MKEKTVRDAKPSQAVLEAEVDRLRIELFVARRALIYMASRDFQDIFRGVFGCKTRNEAFDWFRSAVEKAVKRVKPRPAQEMGDSPHNGPRAYCPMCGASSDRLSQIQGFSHPHGLRRHLKGSHNTRQCKVMKAALELACEPAMDTGPYLQLGALRKRGATQPKR